MGKDIESQGDENLLKFLSSVSGNEYPKDKPVFQEKVPRESRWATDDDAIVPQGRVGRGSLGAVYQVPPPKAYLIIDVQLADSSGSHICFCFVNSKEFARKLIRPTGFDEQDIDLAIANEIRVINKISENGKHPNIITVLEHREMPGDTYALDMELCEMNLGQFINGEYINAMGNQYFDPLCKGDVPGCLTMWTIMHHVTNGLDYIHSLREVHRDLKPQNVLLSLKDNAWKLTDFGLTFEGTSRIKYTTKYSQGSDGYRAPEMLGASDSGTFVTKGSDIWALGCIFYELACRKKAFCSDIDTAQYFLQPYNSKCLDPLPMDKRTAVSIRELICRSLDIDWWKRPAARDVLQVLDSRLNNPVERIFYVGELEPGTDASLSSTPPLAANLSSINSAVSTGKDVNIIPTSQAAPFFTAGANSLRSHTDNSARNPSCEGS